MHQSVTDIAAAKHVNKFAPPFAPPTIGGRSSQSSDSLLYVTHSHQYNRVSSLKWHVSMLSSGFGYLRKSVLILTMIKKWEIVGHFRKVCAAARRKILQRSLCSSSTLKHGFPHILQSLLAEILTEILGYKNLCARSVQ